ncbi:MAG: hypothetical protein M3Q07_05975 [Pseudobdellovibrionaceae bacterium]|nr:hypothetical protein [Pseudobdellovibrionaceae bacterium]
MHSPIVNFIHKLSLQCTRLIHEKKFAEEVGYESFDLGFYFVTISLLGNHGIEAIQALDESIESFQRIDEPTLKKYMTSSEADLLRSLQTPAQRAEVLGHYLTHRNGIEALQTDLSISNSLSLNDVKAAAKKYMISLNRIAVIGVPKGSKP